MRGHLYCPAARSRSSLSDAEAIKDTIQKIIGVDGADNFSQLGQGGADFLGHKFVAAKAIRNCGGPAQGRRRKSDALAAAFGRTA
jgi:hypothetical protein